MKPCVIFDMDGTLVDSSLGMTKSVNHVRHALGLPAVDVSMLTHYINTPGENLAKRFYGTEEFNPSHRALFQEHYMEHCVKELRIYEGIVDVLEKLLGKTTLAIATNASDFFAKKMLDGVGIGHYFELIIGANTLGTSKPEPDMLLHISDHFGSQSARTLVIGDSQKDELAAQNAKMPFIYVGWGYGNYQPGTSLICHEPEDLFRMIQRTLNL